MPQHIQERGETRRSTLPLPFVLAADLLHSIINKARERGVLSLPLELQHSIDFLYSMQMTP